MSLVTKTNNLLEQMSATRAQFTTNNLSPSRAHALSRMRLSDGGDLGVIEDSAPFKRKTTFGFVPVFDSRGVARIYIRMGGGPEILRKGQSGMDVENSSGFYGDGARAFQSKYEDLDNSATTGMEFLLYAHQMGGAPERDMIESAEFNVHPFVTKRQVAEFYPFRLSPNGDTMVLEYAPHGSETYSAVSDPLALSSFLIEMFDNLYLDAATDGTADQVVASISDANASLEIVETVLDKMKDDLKLVSGDYLTLWADSSALLSNGWDHPFVAAFLQLSGKTTVDFESGGLQELQDTVNRIADQIPQAVTAENVNEAVPLVISHFAHYAALAGDENMLAQLQADLSALKATNTDLRKKAKELAKKSAHRYAGLTAGAISAYLSVRNSDLEDWQKISIVALGGALGMVPTLNYFTIAGTPLAVKYGQEYLRSRRSPVNSGLLAQEAEVLALPAPLEA